MTSDQAELGDRPNVPAELAELGDATRSADASSSSSESARPAGAAPIVNPDEAAAQEWALVPMTMGQIICRALPEVKPDWSKENALEWGRAFAPIAKEKGWTVSDFMKWLGPWVGVALVSERMLAPTVIAGYRRIQAARAAAAKDAEPKPAPAVAAP